MKYYPLFDIFKTMIKSKIVKGRGILNDVFTITLFWEKCQMNYFVRGCF